MGSWPLGKHSSRPYALRGDGRPAAPRPFGPGAHTSGRRASKKLAPTQSVGARSVRGLAARGSALAALLLALLPACSTEDGSAAGLEPLRPGPNPKSEIRNPKSKNPLAFQGQTLDGWAFDLAERNARRRILVYLFDPAAPASDTGTRIAQRLHAGRHAHNLEVVGIAVPPGYIPLAAQRIPRQRPKAPELAKLAKGHLDKLGADFPCVPDPDAAIVERYTLAWGMSRLDQLPAFYPFEIAAADSDRPVFPRHAEKAPDPADYLFRRILRRFHIEPGADVDPLLGHHPPAPPFTVTDTAGKAHSLRDYAGRTLVLILFARDCPLCKDLLTYLGRACQQFNLPQVPKPAGGSGLDVLAVCTDVAGDALKALAAERGHPFPTAADADWSLRTALRYRGTVPDVFVIGPDGTVRFRHRDAFIQTPALLQMEISVLLGLPVRPMLERGLYSGDQACRICHPRQHADWTLTRHACAWEVRGGRQCPTALKASPWALVRRPRGAGPSLEPARMRYCTPLIPSTLVPTLLRGDALSRTLRRPSPQGTHPDSERRTRERPRYAVPTQSIGTRGAFAACRPSHEGRSERVGSAAFRRSSSPWGASRPRGAA